MLLFVMKPIIFKLMSRPNTYSPLRYPGGKAIIAKYLRKIIKLNSIDHCNYYELYAGGAGAALDLLFSGDVERIILNDADKHIYYFWDAVLNQSEQLIEKIKGCNLTIDEWRKQRMIYDTYQEHSPLDIGFSTFFLNRCNRSGILSKAGPIGGFKQDGNYKLDARFNKEGLIKRIQLIVERKDAIEIHNDDTLDFIDKHQKTLCEKSTFMYLDPPYYNKGKSLYLNYYTHKDHEELRDLLLEYRDVNWLVSYDYADEILQLYEAFITREFELNYSLQNKRKASELFIYSDKIEIPTQ